MSKWMDNAKKWRFLHSDHVGGLMDGTRASYPPSGSDCHRPELWKGAHWNWLFRTPLSAKKQNADDDNQHDTNNANAASGTIGIKGMVPAKPSE